eukprot:900019-Pyramimonas_sp.AAC.1
MDRGRRRQRLREGSEAHFLHVRRMPLRDGAGDEQPDLNATRKRIRELDVSTSWTDKHEKELQFAKDKLKSRRVQAEAER